jgi:hypothetical protein
VPLPQPSPRSWDPGDIGSVTLLNEQVRDSFGYLLGEPVFVARQAVAQSIANSIVPFTLLNWDYTILDSYNGHSTVSNPTRYTVPFSGVWLFYGVVVWAVNATGRRLSQIFWNGSTQVQTEQNVVTTGGNSSVQNWWVGPASIGDYFEFGVYQSSGAALSTQTAAVHASSYFQASILGSHL